MILAIKPCVTELDLAGAETMLVRLNEPRYRAKQLFGWVYRRQAASFETMTDFPKSLREKLAGELVLSSVTPAKTRAARDGTTKALLSLIDGETIETVLMPGTRATQYTVCLSTQVGCAVCCPFCATGQQGFKRNLSPAEMVDQALYFQRYLGAQNSIANIVFMGMGEPLANYDNLMAAIERLNAAWGFGLGARAITISTAGLVPGIMRLAREKLQVGLAISLHAPNDALRDKLVPLNKKYPLNVLMTACEKYIELSGRRLSFEYCLFAGINDRLELARELAHLLRGMNAHVNLIAANACRPGYRPPSKTAVLAFEDELKRLGINVTLRRSLGRDIEASCGQLKSQCPVPVRPKESAEKEVQDTSCRGSGGVPPD
jgi:23S rRNA (adenine2503-C2)-methyltransferase